jgi:hypothetical protein
LAAISSSDSHAAEHEVYPAAPTSAQYDIYRAWSWTHTPSLDQVNNGNDRSLFARDLRWNVSTEFVSKTDQSAAAQRRSIASSCIPPLLRRQQAAVAVTSVIAPPSGSVRRRDLTGYGSRRERRTLSANIVSDEIAAPAEEPVRTESQQRMEDLRNRHIPESKRLDKHRAYAIARANRTKIR